ncbi:hypothetical protein AWB64_05331 [Caballeronia sordidicola]|uniref:Uncharacterized protein n=1 Tax=Caballeronia sordidicola TaxID=196367 RepID=A0A158I1C3_CABSO|nr:hypothetical protein [Caballeronia sordidicola]SAL50402.1 hypothetical protein AWB64_05331 [Caballeronia sordidicola]
MQLSDKIRDTLKSLASLIPHLFRLAWKAVIVLGGIVLVAYCYFENILPEGLTTGDAFFLASAALSIASIAIVGLGYGAFAAVWLVKLLVALHTRWRATKGLPATSTVHRAISDTLMSVMSFLVTLPFVGMLIYGHAAPDMHFRGTLIFFIASGAFTTVMFGIMPVAVQPRTLQVTVGVCLLATIGILAMTRPGLLNLAMVNLGVRTVPGEMILASDTAHTQLMAAAKISGLKIKFCSVPETEQWGTQDGIGDSSYLRLLDESSGGVRNVLVRVERAAVNPLRGEGVTFKYDLN